MSHRELSTVNMITSSVIPFLMSGRLTSQYVARRCDLHEIKQNFGKTITLLLMNG